MNGVTDSEFKELIDAYKAFYFNKGVSPLTDKEYDERKKLVEELNPGFNIFKYFDADREEVKHPVTFPPLKKYQLDKSDYDKMIKDNKWLLDMKSKGHLAEPKASGCSIVVYYNEDGELIDILTKSNDYSGKRKLKLLNPMVPKKVRKGIRAINCEAIIDLDKGKGYGSESGANGLINSVHKPDEVYALITLIAWDVILYTKEGSDKLSYYESLYDLVDDSFKVMEPIPADINALQWDPIYKTPKGAKGGEFSMLIDGWVIYDKNHNLKYALKFYYNMAADVVIKDIEYNLSDKLGYIPKIKFDPVKLEHSTVKQCASNGIMNLIDKKLGVGSKIRVARVNSSSPQCIKVIEANGFKYPKCPKCKTQLGKDDIIKSVIYCSNPLCPDKLNWVSRHIGNIELEKIYKNPDKYSIDALNLSNFDKNKKRKKVWSKEDIDSMVSIFESMDSLKFYDLIKSHFELNNDDKKKAKYMVTAVVNKINQKLFNK